MKIINYASRKDELEGFDIYSKKFDFESKSLEIGFGPDTADLASGYDAITIVGNCNCNKEAIEKIHSLGVKYIGIRAAGYNNIDLETCKKLGIKVSNVPAYSPNSVSEFVVGLALTMTRNIHQALNRSNRQDFSLENLIGREIKDLTVGVIGTGRIGFNVAKTFAGFGGKVLVNDLYPNEDLKKYAEYKDLDYLISNSDIITLHCPLFDDNYHMINKDSISKMKDGVILINAARGGLVNTEDLLEGLLSEKIRSAALDTYEYEAGIFFQDYSQKLIQDDTLARLLQLPNVLVTPHCAFYTETAVKNIIETAYSNFNELEEKGSCKNEVSI